MMPHGTHSRYAKGCRCKQCTEGHRTYEREKARHRRRVKMGIELPVERLIDGAEVREHIKFLRSRGIGLGTIANEIGTHRSNMQRIASGTQEKILISTHNKILAVSSIPKNPQAFVSAEPIYQLLDELQQHGVTKTEICRTLGYRKSQLQIKKYVRLWRFNLLQATLLQMLRPFRD